MKWTGPVRSAFAFSWLSVVGPAVGQGPDAVLAEARQKIDAKQWQQAVDLLLTVVALPATAVEREQMAKWLAKAGVGLRAVDAFEPGLRAHLEALAVRERLYGDRAHPDVATSLNEVALCLQSLGRPREALPRLEKALAMWQQLKGGDDPAVAVALNNVAYCLDAVGRTGEALAPFQAALAMQRRLHVDSDHVDVAQASNNVAFCLDALGRPREALPEYEASLSMWQRLAGKADHRSVATSLNNMAGCLQSLGRHSDALPRYQEALAMRRRFHGDRDHHEVAGSLNNVAGCIEALGRPGDALPLCEAALAMWQRLNGGGDHAAVALSLNSVAFCLQSLGRSGEALPKYRASLAMRRRLFGDGDHAAYALTLNNLAICLGSLGRLAEALPQYEAALAMRNRVYGGKDHSDVAASLASVAFCLQSLGRSVEALPKFEQALAMQERLHGDRDHPDAATTQALVGDCLASLGRWAEALPYFARALAVRKRLNGDGDHPDVAMGQHHLARCIQSLGGTGDALAKFTETLAMRSRLYGGGDHPNVAATLNNVGQCLDSLGRSDEALPRFQQALAMWQRLYGDLPHPDLVASHNNLAACLYALDRYGEAISACAAACDMIERLREQSAVSADLKQAYFDDLKMRGGVYERLQLLGWRSQPLLALAAAERSRGRDLLDVLEQQRFDPLDEVEQRAVGRGDDAARKVLQQLRADTAAAVLESDRLLHELTRVGDLASAAERDQRRAELLVQAEANAMRRRGLEHERARLVADVLPGARVCTAAELQSVLRQGELLLEFTVTEMVALLYVLARDGDLEVVELPAAHATLGRVLPDLLAKCSHQQLPLRGRDPGKSAPGDVTVPGRELFASLIPPALWERIRTSRRVFVAGHRALHRLPFELLVTGVREGRPVYWLDSGPPISYVPSGSILHWLRSRPAAGVTATIELLAVGDPRGRQALPEVPGEGVLVVKVDAAGEGGRIGLQAGDVLTRYDDKPLVDDLSLREQRLATERAIGEGRRGRTPVPIEVWRTGSTLRVEASPGLLGIEVAPGKAALAHEAALTGDAKMQLVTRSGDLERIGRLPPLRGARAEAEGIERLFHERSGKTRCLVDAEATEPAVLAAAQQARFVHFACHGIAEEYAGQSLSMLVLRQPLDVLPDDDGLLKLSDLLHGWRGRLASCQLVVLSACRTNVGPTLRDEAPQALPLGFLFAGAPSVISSLWAVDDASTKELMTDFYARLLAGGSDRLAAFTAARQALRQKYSDPFHWAPFLFLGGPE